MRGAYYSEFDPGAAAWLRELIGAGLIPAGDVDERDIREVEPTELAEYRQCHFFAGIGGWPLALRLAGWPDDRPVWTGSCPCQPFSSAGKRKGVGDERHLWPDFLRLIEACRPPVILGEQVASAEVVGTELEAAFVVAVRRGDHARANKLAKRLAQSGSLHFHRRWLDGVRADLEGAGYAFGSSVLGAHSEGAPHIRQRLYWVADANRNHPAEVIPGDQAERGQRPPVGRWSEFTAGVGAGSGTSRRDHPAGTGRAGDGEDAGGTGHSGRVADAQVPRGRADAGTVRVGTSTGLRGEEGQNGRRPGIGSGRAGDSGATGRVGDANQPGPQGRGVPVGGRAGGRVVGPAGGDADFWSDFDLIPCRDGKWRRVPAGHAQPGVLRLADGVSAGVAGVRGEGDAEYPPLFPLTRQKVPGRAGLLRGYGNAIVPQTAAEFIRAFLERSEVGDDINLRRVLTEDPCT